MLNSNAFQKNHQWLTEAHYEYVKQRDPNRHIETWVIYLPLIERLRFEGHTPHDAIAMVLEESLKQYWSKLKDN